MCEGAYVWVSVGVPKVASVNIVVLTFVIGFLRTKC